MSAAKDLERMWEEVRDGVEGLDRAFRAPGQVDDDGFVANHGDTAGKQGGWRFLGTLPANLFGDAGNEAVGSVGCSLGSGVARAETCTTGGEKKFSQA